MCYSVELLFNAELQVAALEFIIVRVVWKGLYAEFILI